MTKRDVAGLKGWTMTLQVLQSIANESYGLLLYIGEKNSIFLIKKK